MKLIQRIKKIVKGMIGKSVLAVIKISKRAESTIIYAGPGIGDALYSLAFIEEYKRQNPNRKVIIWTSPKLKELVSSFNGYDRVVVIKSKLFTRLLWQVWSWSSDPRLGRKAADAGIFNQMAYINDLEKNVITRARDSIYRVGEEAKISFHHFPPQKVTCIPNFYEDCQKIIVINPYSASMRTSDDVMNFLARMAQHLQGGGLQALY